MRRMGRTINAQVPAMDLNIMEFNFQATRRIFNLPPVKGMSLWGFTIMVGKANVQERERRSLEPVMSVGARRLGAMLKEKKARRYAPAVNALERSASLQDYP